MVPINLLAIAPYEGLKELFYQCARQYPHIALEVFVGNLDDAIQDRERLRSNQYDVIISRGGTAQMLRNASDIPVVEIEISIYDMLRIIKTAQQSQNRFTIVGFRNITQTAKLICEIMKYDIDIHEIISEEDARQYLADLAKQGIDLVIGDVVTVEAAKQVGLNNLLITSGPESVNKSIEDACHLFDSIHSVRGNEILYKTIADNCTAGICYHSADGRHEYKNKVLQQWDNSKMSKWMQQQQDTAQEQNSPVVKTFDTQSFEITAASVADDQNKGTVYYVKKVSLQGLGASVQVDTVDSAVKPFCLFSASCAQMYDRLCRRLEENPLTPVRLYGETGTGKAPLARYIHFNNGRRGSLFVSVDCELLSERRWEKIMEQSSNVFQGEGHTVFFKNIHTLSTMLQKEIASFLSSTRLCERNSLVCSSIHSLEHSVAEDKFSLALFECFQGASFPVPALREHPEDIPTLCSLLISQYNAQYAKQVIGFDADALEYIKRYRWELNEIQLRSTLAGLVADTQNYYITVAELINALPSRMSPIAAGVPINLSGTLEEIERDVIHYVLHDENMNQTNAAKRLKISRSTLWRKIK